MGLVRHCSQLISPFEALQRVFIPFSTLSFLLRHPPVLTYGPRQLRNLYVYRKSRRVTLPTAPRRPQDEQIQAAKVHLVCDVTETILPPEDPYAILARMDRKQNFLVEVSPATATSLPVCRILSKVAVRMYEKQKNSPNTKTVDAQAKALEFNWAISQNDLQHKLDRLTTFLKEGRRVEVVLARRRKGREATEAEKSSLLSAVRKHVENMEGARESKELQWKGPLDENGQVKKRETALLVFEGTTKKPEKKKKYDVALQAGMKSNPVEPGRLSTVAGMG